MDPLGPSTSLWPSHCPPSIVHIYVYVTLPTQWAAFPKRLPNPTQTAQLHTYTYLARSLSLLSRMPSTPAKSPSTSPSWSLYMLRSSRQPNSSCGADFCPGPPVLKRHRRPFLVMLVPLPRHAQSCFDCCGGGSGSGWGQAPAHSKEAEADEALCATAEGCKGARPVALSKCSCCAAALLFIRAAQSLSKGGLRARGSQLQTESANQTQRPP